MAVAVEVSNRRGGPSSGVKEVMQRDCVFMFFTSLGTVSSRFNFINPNFPTHFQSSINQTRTANDDGTIRHDGTSIISRFSSANHFKRTNISLDAQFFHMLIPPSPPFFPLDNRIEKKPMALVCRREIACNRHRPLTQTLNHVCCV